MPDCNEALVAHPNTNTHRVSTPWPLAGSRRLTGMNLLTTAASVHAGSNPLTELTERAQKDGVVEISTLRVSDPRAYVH